MYLALVFGAVIGLALGAGGSILAVPALVYGVGQPLQTAIPTSLAVVALSALGGLVPGNDAAQCDGRSHWSSAPPAPPPPSAEPHSNDWSRSNGSCWPSPRS